MNSFLAKLYASLDQVVLTRMDNGYFEPRSTIPDWFVYFTRDHQASGYDLEQHFPYLACFMESAAAHWRQQETSPLHSGPWMETDARQSEVAFEALAMYLEGECVFIIQRLGEHFREKVSLLQHIRDGLLTQEALELEVRRRTRQIRQREEDITIKLISLTSYRDKETGTHVRRIGMYAAAIAQALGWEPQAVDDIRMAAPMHDIGKVGIPDRILLKAGSLNDDEFEVMKQHTLIGAQMLEGTGIPVLDMAAQIARCHHERWDGSGYPAGLQGEQIPLAARITTVVDVYDALVHERVYKKAIKESEALAIMKDMSGHHLDPGLLQVFLYLLPTMRRIRLDVTEQEDADYADLLVN
ncbi:MAG: HD domain-containing protein [Thiolinea sp.]